MTADSKESTFTIGFTRRTMSPKRGFSIIPSREKSRIGSAAGLFYGIRRQQAGGPDMVHLDRDTPERPIAAPGLRSPLLIFPG